MVGRMLDHPGITVETGVDFRDVVDERRAATASPTRARSTSSSTTPTGPLPYRSLRFEHRTLAVDRFQAAAVVNFPDDAPYTRIIEHAHFADQHLGATTVTYEYPEALRAGAQRALLPPAPRTESRGRYARYAAGRGRAGRQGRVLGSAGRVPLLRHGPGRGPRPDRVPQRHRRATARRAGVPVGGGVMRILHVGWGYPPEWMGCWPGGLRPQPGAGPGPGGRPTDGRVRQRPVGRGRPLFDPVVAGIDGIPYVHLQNRPVHMHDLWDPLREASDPRLRGGLRARAEGARSRRRPCPQSRRSVLRRHRRRPTVRGEGRDIAAQLLPRLQPRRPVLRQRRALRRDRSSARARTASGPSSATTPTVSATGPGSRP